MAALDNVKRLVVKIGSALLVDPETGELRREWLRGLAADIAKQNEMGRDVIVVSSGSIALGRRVLGLAEGALSIEQSQAAAAVGQIRLAQAYEDALSPLNIKTAQILLTLEDSTERRRYLNSRGTMAELLRLNVIPIVNENDSVATDEIRYGDNDRLAARVAAMAGADMLVLLSDVDGIYTADPRSDAKAKHIPIIEEMSEALYAGAGDAGTGLSKGGMRTKLLAAEVAMGAGCAMIIMEGDQERPILRLNEGAKHSLFKARHNPMDARKNWISGMKPKGRVTIDDGAINALLSGKSLLPVGAREISGKFDRGDLVEIVDQTGRVHARGLIRYDASEAAEICGVRLTEMEEKLGHGGRGAMVHRDDMVM